MFMQKLLIVCFIVGLISVAGCSESDTLENKTEAGSDSADTVSKPITAEITKDTTLQPIEEISLKATGNTIEEIAFSEDTITVPAGVLIKLDFINEGTNLPMIHNFVVADSGTYKAVALAGEKAGSSGSYIPSGLTLLASSPLALPGQTVVVEFQAPLKPGMYDYVCTYPGHWQKQHGVLIVK